MTWIGTVMRRWRAGAACLVFAMGLAAEAGRFYSVAERDGVWWFVGPDEERFFSIGPACVDPGGEAGQPRENEYHYSTAYTSLEAWTEDTMRRLRAWNFNTIGGWSSSLLIGKGLPDTPVLHLGVSAELQWKDVFDDAVVRRVEQLAERMAAPRREDPALLGWFSDNELGWYAETAFVVYLGYPAENKTRQTLVAMLREHYGGDIDALGKDFEFAPGTTFETLAEGGTLHLRPGSSGRAVVHAFLEMVARRYYAIMHDAIRRHDPNHLILGDRYNGYYPWSAARAAAPYVDVISTNASFADTRDGTLFPFYARTLHRLTGKPVLISEYYVAAMENQSGNKNSSTQAFTTVPTQVERTLIFEKTLRDILDMPYAVGAHWFQFHDEPPHGREDGEDFNFGLVDIHNAPYRLLTESMTALNAQAEALHAAADGWRADTTIAVPAAPSDPFVGLYAWNKAKGYVPYTSELAFGDMLVCADEQYLYLGLRADDFIDPAIYAGKTLPEEDAMVWRMRFNDQDASIIRFGAGIGARCDNAAVRLRHHDGGLRQVVVVAIPRESLSGTKVVRLQSDARGYARYMTTTWDATLRLD